MKAASRLTAKYQATIPKVIRDVLKLNKGDSVVFEVESNGQISVRKAASMEVEYLRSVEGTLEEWLSTNDEEAYRDL